MKSDFRMKILKKVWISSTEKAAKALSEMIQRDVKVVSTSFRITLLNNLPKLINSRRVTTTIVYNQIKDDIKGVMLLSSSLRGILKLVEILLHKKIGYYKVLSDENIPVIRELWNVVSGYYLSFLVKLFERGLSWERPTISTNPGRAIENFNFGPVYKKKIYVLTFSSVIAIPREVAVQIVLLFKKESMDKLLEAISEKIEIIAA